jgi:alkylation response protein AidB-like acyl-CoA dehydrogenase
MELVDTTIQQQIAEDLKRFKAFLKEEQPEKDAIFTFLRNSTLPYIPCYREELSSKEIFDFSFKFIFTLGHYRLPIAVGLCMNQYILSSIACCPLPPDSPLEQKRDEFLNMVRDQKWIVAVSSFDEPIKSKSQGSTSVQCVTDDQGTYLFNGVKNYQSNSCESDVILFSSVVNGEALGLFFAPLKNNPHIKLNHNLFDNAMSDSDTYQLVFENLRLTQDQVFSIGKQEETGLMHLFSRVWFGYLAMAPYLGGATRAMEEGKSFLKKAQIEDGTALADLDGYVTDYGRLALDLQSAMDATELFGYKLDELTPEGLAEWMGENLPKSSAVKYQVTDVCEDIVTRVRRIVGGRSQFRGSVLSRLTQEIVFGPLHPVINAKLEREFGSKYLN